MEDQVNEALTPEKQGHLVKTSDEIEQKIWDVVRQVPGLNVGYGSVRLIIYIGKGNKKEVMSSATGVAQGLVETAAIVGCYFIAPVVAPIAAGALSGVVSDSIKGVAQVVVVMIESPGELSGTKSADDKEKFLYKEIKNIPALGAAYSALRFPVYLVKGNKCEAVTSGVNSVFGSAASVLKCGADAIHMIDKETEKALEKLSQTIVPLVSKKVLEKVVNNEITLAEGVNVVEALEATCEAVEQEVSRRKSDASMHEVNQVAASVESLAINNTTVAGKDSSNKSRRCLPKLCRLFKCKRTKNPIDKSKTVDTKGEDKTSNEEPTHEAVIIVI